MPMTNDNRPLFKITDTELFEEMRRRNNDAAVLHVLKQVQRMIDLTATKRPGYKSGLAVARGLIDLVAMGYGGAPVEMDLKTLLDTPVDAPDPPPPPKTYTRRETLPVLKTPNTDYSATVEQRTTTPFMPRVEPEVQQATRRYNRTKPYKAADPNSRASRVKAVVEGMDGEITVNRVLEVVSPWANRGDVATVIYTMATAKKLVKTGEINNPKGRNSPIYQKCNSQTAFIANVAVSTEGDGG